MALEALAFCLETGRPVDVEQALGMLLQSGHWALHAPKVPKGPTSLVAGFQLRAPLASRAAH